VDQAIHPGLRITDAENAYRITRPTQSRQDASVPKLRSRLAGNPQRTPHGEGAVLAARGGRVETITLPVSARLRPRLRSF